MLIPLIVLAISLLFLYVGIQGIVHLFICVISFWGEVIWKDVKSIKYSFKAGGLGLVAFVLGLAGTLWSVIVLAIRFASL